ncbi:hypothetical protein MKX01_006210 [Papaver californicum]|nr:hypothetical protein MKX01_006210 [Papaver californicum]
MALRHKNGTGTTPTTTKLPSNDSKMRINVEKSDENKMSLIFLMACFIGIDSAFLIGHMTGIIGGLLFETGFMTRVFPINAYTYDDIVVYSMAISLVPATLYIFGSIGIDIRKQDFSKLDMRRQMILSGALVSLGSVVTALTTSQFLYVLGPNLFAMGFGIIIFVANLVNCFTNSIKSGWGWEVSIGIAAIPAAIISIISFLLPDTPMSMIKLGKFDDAKQLLQRLHGTNDDVYILLKDLLATNESSKPYRVMAIALPLFQQLTGMNVIVIYAPYLFQVIGFQESAALTYTAIIGGVNVAATIIGIISVSRGCRRFFLVVGGVQIRVGQVLQGILIWIKLGGATGPSEVYDYLIIPTTCICVAGFAWSWGLLGWIFLSSDDIQNLSSKVHWNFSGFMTLVFTFMVYLFKFYVLYLFAFFGVIISFLAYYFMPDTNQILVGEDVSKIWKQHWFWRRYFVDLDNDLMV